LVREASTKSFTIYDIKNCEKSSAQSFLLVTRLRVTICPLKDAIRGKKFEDDKEVISEIKRGLRQRPA
jgi:hypothetical protein